MMREGIYGFWKDRTCKGGGFKRDKLAHFGRGYCWKGNTRGLAGRVRDYEVLRCKGAANRD